MNLSSFRDFPKVYLTFLLLNWPSKWSPSLIHVKGQVSKYKMQQKNQK